MRARNSPGDGQQEVLIVEKPEAIRLLYSEKGQRILKLITDDELSISDIARALGINPGSVHYHLKELEKYGLARQVRHEVRGGIVRKFYRSVARRTCLESPDLADALRPGFDLSGESARQVVGSLGCLGFHVSDDRRAEARELLLRFDRRIKELFDEVRHPGPDAAGVDGATARYACLFLVNMRALNDPELGRICGQFSRVFSRDR